MARARRAVQGSALAGVAAAAVLLPRGARAWDWGSPWGGWGEANATAPYESYESYEVDEGALGELLSQFFNVGLASSSGEDYSYQGGFFSGLSGMATEVSWGEGANFHVNDWWFGEDYDYEEEEDDGHKDKHDDDDGRKDRKDKHDDDDGRKDRKDKYDDDDGHKDHGDWGHKGKDKDHGDWGHKGRDKHHGSWGHNDFVYAPQWPSWVEEDNSYDYYESNSPSLNASVGFWSPFSEFFGSYSYDYSYDSYDYTYSYLDFFGDDLLGSLFGELDG